jgi:hypothetical protein
MNFLVRLWVTFQCATLLSVIVAFPLSFKNPLYGHFPILIGSILHVITLIINLRTKPATQQTTKFLLMNFSVHVVAMNLLFLWCGGAPIVWKLALGFGAFYHILTFLRYQVFPTARPPALSYKITQFHEWLTEGGRAHVVLATLEVMVLLGRSGRPGAFVWMVKFYGYLFGYILFQYSVNQTHQQIWRQRRESIVGLITKLPTAIAGILISAIDSIGKFGEIGKKIYSTT